MNADKQKKVISIVAIVGIVILTVWAYQIRDHVFALRRYGYAGIFLIELLANASVFLPIPGSLVTAAVSPLFNPFLLAFLSSLGAALGELFAYAAGMGGHSVVKKAGWYERIEIWLEKYGGFTILAMAAIPNPLFDTAGLAAGALNMRVSHFFAWCWAGKLLNRLIVVFGGAALLARFLPGLWH